MDGRSKSPAKSEVAKERARDESGHFVSPSSTKPPQSAVAKFFAENTHYSKSQDDILDVHIGNPLKK